MASRAEIEFDFQKAKKQADELERIANDIRKVSQEKFENTLQNISSCWKGENAGLYMKKGITLQREITQTSSDLNNIASAIRSTAQRIYDAEMSALRIAERRSYK